MFFYALMKMACGITDIIRIARITFENVSARDVKASFEKAYWRLEPTLPEDKKELAAATLRSIALNYIERRGPRPPKALQQAINQLRRREDIVITKPDKGSGAVVMDKTEYSPSTK